LSLNHTFQAYESTSITSDEITTTDYSANAFLFPRVKFFSHSKPSPSQQLLDTFEINIRLYQPVLKQTILVSFEHTNSTYSLTQVKDSLQDLALASKRHKKFVRSRKTNLRVEACVHINYDVYKAMQSFLSTSNHEYIHMYLSVVYLQYFSGVNRIYESISDPNFSISVDLASLVIHKVHFINVGDVNKSDNYLSELNSKMYEFYNNNNNKSTMDQECDHIFFISIDNWKGACLGKAYLGQVCNQRLFTSLIMHKLSGDIDQTLAHELGHSLGARHDDFTFKKESYNRDYTCKNMLMRTILASNQDGHTISACSISDIRQTLFHAANKSLKNEYKCLLATTSSTLTPNSLNSYHQVLSTQNRLPGHYYSLSDQCRLAGLDKRMYSVMKDSDNKCKVSCFLNQHIDKNQENSRYTAFVISALDGTRCGKNKICISDECREDFTVHKHVKLENPQALQVASICPNGVRQNMSHVRKSECQKNCDNLGYRSQCCEACIKYSFVLMSKTTSQVSVCENSDSNPCYNGGVCVDDEQEGFVCRCPKGYEGDLCLEYRPCRLDSCQKNEICHEIGELGFYACLCPPGHSGYPVCGIEYVRNDGYSLSEGKKPIGYRALINCVFVGLSIFGLGVYIVYFYRNSLKLFKF